VQEVTFVVLGMGRWGNHWLSILSEHDGIDVKATAGRRPGTGDLSTHGKVVERQHYRTYQDAIANSNAEAVLITLPARLHADAILRALDSGKHILCEKPVVTNLGELDRILAARFDHPDQVVMVAQNYRRRAWAQVARRLICSGAVGNIGRVSLRFSQPEFLDGGRREMESPLLDDMSIHHFDLLRFLTGRNAVEMYVQEYRPAWSEFLGSPAVEAIIAFEDGIVVTYSGSWAARGFATTYDGEYLIEGDRGAVRVSEGRVLLDVPSLGEPTVEHVITDRESTDTTTDLHAVLDEFCDAVNDGQPHQTDLEDNRHSIAMIFAAHASIQSGRPAKVATWGE
jgi:predicted dehydrogenase